MKRHPAKSALVVILIIVFASYAYKKSAETRNECACYLNGTLYKPGSQACVEGNEAVCATKNVSDDQGRRCSWDLETDKDGNLIKCK